MLPHRRICMKRVVGWKARASCLIRGGQAAIVDYGGKGDGVGRKSNAMDALTRHFRNSILFAIPGLILGGLTATMVSDLWTLIGIALWIVSAAFALRAAIYALVLHRAGKLHFPDRTLLVLCLLCALAPAFLTARLRH